MTGKDVDGAGGVGEAFKSGEPPAPVGHMLAPENLAPVEGAGRKPQQPQGRLSESTLKAMLQVQEMDQTKPA